MDGFVSRITARLAEHDRGQDLAEYGLLIGLIAVIVIVAVRVFGTNVSALMTGMTFS